MSVTSVMYKSPEDQLSRDLSWETEPVHNAHNTVMRMKKEQ